MERDDVFRSLLKSGFDESVASNIYGYLQLINLETERSFIQEQMEIRGRQLTVRLEQLFDILSEIPGLNHTIPTKEIISGNGINDNIDLSVKVVSTDKREHVSFLWKSHNIHEISNIPHGFVLGDLNTASITNVNNEIQIPILGVEISKLKTQKKLFSVSSDSSTEITYRLNRSWIENKSTASDAELDSNYRNSLEFIDFISDHGDISLYKLVTTLLLNIEKYISDYLGNKREILDRMNF